VTTALCGNEAPPAAEDYEDAADKFTGKIHMVTVELK
jgi:hypothetical protein